MKKSSKGRLVWNHSTHIDGLIPVLEKLSQKDGIQTVTPARLSIAKSNIPHLKLRVSVPIRGGFKIVARNGKAVQEVFLLTTLTQVELEATIAQLLD